MASGLFLPERTVEGVDADGDVVSEAICPAAASRASQPDRDPAMATIGPLVEAEIPFLQRVVRRWYRDAADADDLMQDTLLRALASAHLWHPRTQLARLAGHHHAQSIGIVTQIPETEKRGRRVLISERFGCQIVSGRWGGDSMTEDQI